MIRLGNFRNPQSFRSGQYTYVLQQQTDKPFNLEKLKSVYKCTSVKVYKCVSIQVYKEKVSSRQL